MRTGIGAVAVGVACASFCAGATITVGDHHIAAAAGQTVSIRVTGGEIVQGVTLLVSIQEGGPVPTHLDLKTGAILAGSTNAVDAPVIAGQVILADYSMQFGATTIADGVAGTLTVDASGLVPGSTYVVQLSGAGITSDLNGPSGELGSTLVGGRITIDADSGAGGGSTPPSPPGTDPAPPPVTPPSDPVTDPVDPEEPAGPDTPTDNSPQPDPVVAPDTPTSPGTDPDPVASGGEGGGDLDNDQSPTLAPRMPAPATCAAGVVEGLVMSLLGLCVVRSRRR